MATPISPETTPTPIASSPLHIDVLTIFPEMIEGYCRQSIVGRALQDRRLELAVHDLREGSSDAHRSVDDAPFGGGAGMVLGPEPIFNVVEAVKPARPIILMSPTGRQFDQQVARELAGDLGAFTLLCGRYEGIDQRVIDHLVDDQISIGDVVLAGGELAALVVIEAVARLVPGVLGNEASIVEESFSSGLLEYPHYTRPAEFRGWRVPEVLVGGNHQAIAAWRHAAALAETLAKRPDLIEARGGLRPGEVELLEFHGYPLKTTAPGSARDCEAAGRGDVSLEERDQL